MPWYHLKIGGPKSVELFSIRVPAARLQVRTLIMHTPCLFAVFREIGPSCVIDAKMPPMLLGKKNIYTILVALLSIEEQDPPPYPILSDNLHSEEINFPFPCPFPPPALPIQPCFPHVFPFGSVTEIFRNRFPV